MLAVAIAVLVFSAFMLGNMSPRLTGLGTRTERASFTETLSPVTLVCPNELLVDGARYCALDVTDDMEYALPGYSALKTPVTFMGVKFETVCDPNMRGCATRTLETATGPPVTLGVVSFILTFPDNTKESLTELLPLHDGPPLYVLSKHTDPRGGFSMTYAPIGSLVHWRTLLLVEVPTLTVGRASFEPLNMCTGAAGSAGVQGDLIWDGNKVVSRSGIRYADADITGLLYGVAPGPIGLKAPISLGGVTFSSPSREAFTATYTAGFLFFTLTFADGSERNLTAVIFPPAFKDDRPCGCASLLTHQDQQAGILVLFLPSAEPLEYPALGIATDGKVYEARIYVIVRA